MEQRKWFNKTVILIYVKTFFWYDGLVESKCQYGIVHLVIPNIDGIIYQDLIWKMWKSQRKQQDCFNKHTVRELSNLPS